MQHFEHDLAQNVLNMFHEYFSKDIKKVFIQP